jgi:hypothetical protein
LNSNFPPVKTVAACFGQQGRNAVSIIIFIGCNTASTYQFIEDAEFSSSHPDLNK